MSDTDCAKSWYQTLLHTDLGKKKHLMMVFSRPSLTQTQRLAEAARQGLRMVAAGEDKTMEGWLVYGAALNAGRKLFDLGGMGDRRFGAWIVDHQLGGPHDLDRAAAMWAAADEAAFEETRRLHPRVRTVRGLHAKWKEAQRPEPKEAKPAPEEPSEGDLRRMESLRSTVNHPNTETHVRAAAQKSVCSSMQAAYMAKEDGGAP